MELQKKKRKKKKKKCCDLIQSQFADLIFQYTMNLQKKKISIKRCCRERLDSITDGTIVSVSLFKSLYSSFSLSLSLSLSLYLTISFSLLFAANHIMYAFCEIEKRWGKKKKLTLSHSWSQPLY